MATMKRKEFKVISRNTIRQNLIMENIHKLLFSPSWFVLEFFSLHLSYVTFSYLKAQLVLCLSSSLPIKLKRELENTINHFSIDFLWLLCSNTDSITAQQFHLSLLGSETPWQISLSLWGPSSIVFLPSNYMLIYRRRWAL